MGDFEYGHWTGTNTILITSASQQWFTITRDSLRVRENREAEWRLPTRAEAAVYFGEEGIEEPQPEPEEDQTQLLQPPPPVVITRADAIRRAAGAMLYTEHLARTQPALLAAEDYSAQIQAAQVWATLAVAFIDDDESYTIDLSQPPGDG